MQINWDLKRTVTLRSITPDNFINTIRKYHDVIFLILAGVLFFSFTLSKALISISFGLICVLGMFSISDLNFGKRNSRLIIAFLILYGLFLLSFLNSDNKEEAIRMLILKVPLLLFPFLLNSVRRLTSASLKGLALIINYAIYLPAVISVYNYFLNKELFDDLILQSKPLPVEFGYGILHINFSILLACAIVFGLFQLIQWFRNGQLGLLFYTLIFLVTANFIFIHVLSARTGLVGLYAGMAVLVFSQFIRLPFRKSRWLLAAIIVIPMLMISISGSLRNRIINTAEDLKVVLQGRNANDYSFAMRVRAWQNSWDVISREKWLGVGIGDAEVILYNNFAVFDPEILPENRKNPHFQILETAVQTGLTGAFVYLAIFVLAFMRMNGRVSYLLIAAALLLFTASCFESILESQVSVIAFVFFIALGAGHQPDPLFAESDLKDEDSGV